MDAESQPGYAGSPIIVFNGLDIAGDGLDLGAGSGGSTIGGFDIIDFSLENSSGQTAGIAIESNDNVLQGNYVGVLTNGSSALYNIFGVYVTGNNNTIGGTVPGAANLISGNDDGVYIDSGSNNVVVDNLIGTDATGTIALGNTFGVTVVDAARAIRSAD